MSKFRVAEIFGPTIQGEGRLVGMPCHFVRFGGCDFKCSWCDTPHAVLPDQVAELDQMDEWGIINAVNELDKDEDAQRFIRWVVLTGGNPGLFNLQYLIELFHARKYKVMVETQGSTFRPWYADVDDLCFSPKPPSSGMDWSFEDFRGILKALQEAQLNHKEVPRDPYLKVPIFTPEDLDFAERVHTFWPDLQMFLSVGNDNMTLPTVGNPHPQNTVAPGLTLIEWARESVLDNFQDLVATILRERPALQDCRVFPQQHVLLWGNARGH